VASTSAEDSALQTSAGEPSAVEFVAAPVVPDAITIKIPEVTTTTSISTESAVGLSLHKVNWLLSLWTLYAPI